MNDFGLSPISDYMGLKGNQSDIMSDIGLSFLPTSYLRSQFGGRGDNRWYLGKKGERLGSAVLSVSSGKGETSSFAAVERRKIKFLPCRYWYIQHFA
jgi:hypothetical protein